MSSCMCASACLLFDELDEMQNGECGAHNPEAVGKEITPEVCAPAVVRSGMRVVQLLVRHVQCCLGKRASEEDNHQNRTAHRVNTLSRIQHHA